MGVAHVTALKDGSLVFSNCAGGSSGCGWGAVGVWLVDVGGAGAGEVVVRSVLAPIGVARIGGYAGEDIGELFEGIDMALSEWCHIRRAHNSRCHMPDIIFTFIYG